MRIVQNEVLDMDKFPFEPKRGGRIVEVKAFDKPVAHRRAGETLVETRHSVFRRDQRAGDLSHGLVRGISPSGMFIAHWLRQSISITFSSGHCGPDPVASCARPSLRRMMPAAARHATYSPRSSAMTRT
ncbi:hypothetical protein [Mesorhizobium sp. L48C026A00]|uniref:hypothetical protein n=1 Tax=Mesorhizobium sp. L48C026A00 TaxID=1287182 RepID=UPI001FD96536|nr:hypothetical protein [Mesorhizobium sp. L48C026A00]